MTPRLRRAAAGLGGVAILLGAAACTGSAGRQPTVASVDFAPKLVVEVDDDGIGFVAGRRADAAVSTDPASVPSGSVVEVVNTGAGEHRLQAGKAFDTGQLRPGDRTTVVLVDDGEVLITDRAAPDHTARLRVTPRAAAG